ncbi:MAG: hypothetical protein IJU75_04965 [Clostridia bacterium]|nr:hypothetical protein [Clostridia bacterium]
MSKLRYGLKNGELVFIDDVANGLQCACVCPNCGGILEAHQGQKKEHHFKHYNSTDCEHGAETSLHLMVKRIVAKEKAVFVPNAPKSTYDFSRNGKCYKFDESFVEKEIAKDIRADVLLRTGSIDLNVEIKVSHKVDETKRIKLFNYGIRTIEIDLSNMIDTYNDKTVIEAITSGSNTTLLYSPKSRVVYAKWLLGDWKDVHRDHGGSLYVKNCPKSQKNAYFMAYEAYNDHGPDECHECFGFSEFSGGEALLCRGFYGNIDFDKIDRIEEIIRVNNVVSYAHIIVDGKELFFGKK